MDDGIIFVRRQIGTETIGGRGDEFIRFLEKDMSFQSWI
jgi:hypothetical protein